MKQNIWKAVFIFLASPALIWALIHPIGIVKEWAKIPSDFKNNLGSIIGNDKLSKVEEERWNAFGPKREELVSKIYYNKAAVLVDDFFTMLTYLSPRLYFQSGDGSPLSPPHVEPVAIPLFFFWIAGLVDSIRKGKFKLIAGALLFAVFTYFFGQRNLAFLLPVLVVYEIIAVRGIESLKNGRCKNIVFVFIALYGIFLIGRVFLLR